MIYVSNIQRFSIHDGPGIRTTVFFKGCNLRCLWCHNPETFEMKAALQYFNGKCSACGRCAEVCPKQAISIADGKVITDRSICKLCGACVNACPNDAREINGEAMTAEAIMDVVVKDKAYYLKSGGGITLSGGEPLLQPDGAAELLNLAKNSNISTAVETALNVKTEVIDKILPLTDYFMCDIKAADDSLHRELTGAGNKQILENIRHISSSDKEMLLRMPVVPGMNDSEENLLQTAEFINGLPNKHRLELLRFHSLARDKYSSLSLAYKAVDVVPPDNDAMARYKKIFADNGVDVIGT